MSSSTIRSSTLNEPTAAVISLRRSFPYFSATSRSSSLRMPMRTSSEPKISRSSSMSARTSDNSSSSFSISRPVRRASLMSRIALACRSVRLNELWSSCDAVLVSLDPRMTLITSSMLSTATLRPSRICSRSSALLRSYSVRRTMTSCL